MKIKEGSKVSVQYILREDNAEGEVIEQTTPEEPLRFVLGEDPMLPGFEKALEGLGAGDRFSVRIPVAEAYGEEDEGLYIEYPKETFIEDGELDEELLQEGEIIPMETPEGDEVVGVVAEVKLNSVIVDFNHPLAGLDLYFEGEVLTVE